MNYTVIPKSIMNFQTGNSKPVDVYVWAVIKCCSNHKTNISHVTEEKLSLLTGLDERSIRRSIKRLKDAGYLTVQTSTVKEDADRGFIKRNMYHIKPEKSNYFFLDNSYFKRNYPAKIAGFLLLLKSVCLNNTDTIQWSNSQIAKAIGLSRNTTTALIKECQQLGLIKVVLSIQQSERPMQGFIRSYAISVKRKALPLPSGINGRCPYCSRNTTSSIYRVPSR